MFSKYPFLKERRIKSEKRLEELQSKIQNLSELNDIKDLCIYVTGSYGRREASTYSDLDLFFLHKGSWKNDKLPRIKKTLLDAELIKLCESMEFPPFSLDGEYLKIHYLQDMKDALGSNEDDYNNYFTARLLLLLESYPVYNNTAYEKMVKSIIETYFRDYHDHHENFKPIFLVNDIIRFWKTLCLNYEHKRNRDDQDRKMKSHIKNLKLKFSRLLTCFSMIHFLNLRKDKIDINEMYSIVVKTPMERILDIGKVSGSVEDVDNVAKEYEWFLRQTGKQEKELINWLSDEKNRNDAFKHARDFGKSMYNILAEKKDTPEFQYLVI